MNNPFRNIAKKVSAPAQVPRKHAERLPAISVEMAKECFREQRNPYWERWGDTVTGLPFDKRGGLERSVRAVKSALKFYVVVDHKAFIYHQNAMAPGRVRRLMLPVRSRGLGLWGARYKEEARKLWREAMKS